jgi:glycosyltransferase involved in cell wall biosynthesis
MKYQVDHQPESVTFSPPRTSARVLMVPFATSANLIETVLKLGENQHHAWGVKELLQADVEVTVVRRYGPKWERFGQDWRLPDPRRYDLIYSNHNRLIRTPLERILGVHKVPFASLVYAGEPLLAARRHWGILCMTPHAYSRFSAQDGVRVRYAPWGIDPESALHQVVQPTGQHFVSTGVTGRDFTTLFQAARRSNETVMLAARGQAFSEAPANVQVIDEVLTPWQIRDQYKGAYAGLMILNRDDRKREAVGWTNMLELMAVGLPIIKTRTGTLDDIVDLEAIGAGILVEPGDTAALAQAMNRLRENSALRLEMGWKAAAYVRTHLTMKRFAEPLIELVNATRG